MGGSKPVPLSFTQPMIDAAISSQQLPYTQAIAAPLAASFPTSKAPKPVKEFKYVNAPITVC
jgi:Flp pilus assembly protein protease CpaA